MFDMIPWKRTGGKEMTRFRREFENLVERFFNVDFPFAGEFFKEDRWAPRVDIVEREGDIRVKAEIPGVDVKDIELKLDGRILTIKGEKKKEKEEKQENYYRLERSSGFFHRSLELPAEVDPESVEARFKKGVLTVVLKKIKTTSAKSIEIQSS